MLKIYLAAGSDREELTIPKDCKIDKPPRESDHLTPQKCNRHATIRIYKTPLLIEMIALRIITKRIYCSCRPKLCYECASLLSLNSRVAWQTIRNTKSILSDYWVCLFSYTAHLEGGEIWTSEQYYRVFYYWLTCVRVRDQHPGSLVKLEITETKT